MAVEGAFEATGNYIVTVAELGATQSLKVSSMKVSSEDLVVCMLRTAATQANNNSMLDMLLYERNQLSS